MTQKPLYSTTMASNLDDNNTTLQTTIPNTPSLHPEKQYMLIHQTICISELDIHNKHLAGSVEFHFVPTKLKLSRIKLNSKQCGIVHILARGSKDFLPATFSYNDPLLEIIPETRIENGQHSALQLQEQQLQHQNHQQIQQQTNEAKTLKRFSLLHQEAVFSTEPDFGNGEIIVQLPEQVQKDISDGSTFRILVEYVLDNPSGGIHFVSAEPQTFSDIENQPQINGYNTHDDEYEQNFPTDSTKLASDRQSRSHVFTYKNQNSSRLWFPCIDSYHHPCSWELEFTVHSDLTVISCGNLISTNRSQENDCVTYKYELRTPTAAPNIGFVAGNFEMHSESTVPIKYFYLPGLKQLVQEGCHFMQDCFNYYEDILSFKYPYSSYTLVFVDEAYEDCQDYATLSICNTNILHSETILDQVFNTRNVLCKALAHQYFGCFIAMTSWNSAWLIRGISMYIGAQFRKQTFGNNECRFEIQDTMKKLIDYEQRFGGIVLDNGGNINSNTFHFSIANPATVSPFYDAAHKNKSFLVIRMLEDRIEKSLLLQVLNKILSLALTASIQPAGLNAWSNMLLSTKNFEKAVFTVTGKDKEIAVFLDTWVYQGGHAKISGRFVFDRKRNVVELEIRQLDGNSPGIRPYYGPITITVQEFDGTFAQKLNIEENKTTPFVITCHSKSRRNKKKKIPLITGEEVDMDLSMMDNNDSPVLWIRIDPEMLLLRQVLFEQPDYQWQYQLKYERDVTAQMDALQVLEKYPTVTTRRILTEMLEDERCYYRVRCAAALMLTKVANQMALLQTTGGWQASTVLINIFKKFYGSNSNPHIIKHNQFSTTDLPSYFLQKSLPMAMAGLRVPPHLICPADVVKFLLDLFKYNDNSKNDYSDNYYRAALIEAVAETVTPVVVPIFTNSTTTTTADQLSSETKWICEEITRCLNLEKILPSFKFTISIACLKASRKLQRKGHLPINSELFRYYTSYKVFTEVRHAAITEIVDIVKAEHSEDDLLYLLDLIENDPVSAFKFYIISELHRDPPQIHNFPHSKLVFDRLWELMNVRFAHDSKLRCATADLFHLFFDRHAKHSISIGNDGDSHKMKKKKKKDKKSRENRESRDERKEKKNKNKRKKKMKMEKLRCITNPDIRPIFRQQSPPNSTIPGTSGSAL